MTALCIPRGLSRCVILAAWVVAGSAASVLAQGPKAGPVKYFNATKSDIKVQGRYFIDSEGRRVDLSFTWNMAAGEKSGFVFRDKDLVARRFAYTLITPEGRSD